MDSLGDLIIRDVNHAIDNYNDANISYHPSLLRNFGRDGNGWGVTKFSDKEIVKQFSANPQLAQRFNDLAKGLVKREIYDSAEADSLLKDIEYKLVLDHMSTQSRFRYGTSTHLEDATKTGYLDSLRTWLSENKR